MMVTTSMGVRRLNAAHANELAAAKNELHVARDQLKKEIERSTAVAKALRESEDRYRKRELEMIAELQNAHLERRRLRDSLEDLYERHETLLARMRVLQAAIGVMSDDITENSLRTGHSMARDTARSRAGTKIDGPVGGLRAPVGMQAQWNGDGCNRPTTEG